MGILSWYLRMLDIRPLITKSISAGLIYAAADFTAQIKVVIASAFLGLISCTSDHNILYGCQMFFVGIIRQSMTMGASDSLNLLRTLRIAIFGLLLLGPAQHLWFNFLGKILPKRDMTTTFKKLVVGQIFYGPTCTAGFFIYNATLQGESGSEIYLRLRRDLLPTLTGGLMYWPVCDFFTYKIVPVHLQPLMNSSFSFLWTIYLTYMASLEKAMEA